MKAINLMAKPLLPTMVQWLAAPHFFYVNTFVFVKNEQHFWLQSPHCALGPSLNKKGVHVIYPWILIQYIPERRSQIDVVLAAKA